MIHADSLALFTSSQGIADLRRAEILARKVNLLLDVVTIKNGEHHSYIDVRDHAVGLFDCYISRTRWSMIKNGKALVAPPETLKARALVFDVDAEY